MSDPSDWTEATDKKTGKTYYYNKKTKKTQWSKPEELGGSAAKAGGAVAASKKKGSDSDASDKGSDDEGEKAGGGGGGGADPQEDPKNWQKTKDKKTGKEYYYNKVTKKTSWKKPACLPASDDEEEPAAKKPAAKEEPAAAAAADAGDWKETIDKKTGKKYWYNKVTKKTTWKDPTKAEDDDDGASKKKKKGSDDDSGDDDDGGSDAGSEDEKPAAKAGGGGGAAAKKAAGSDDDDEEEEKAAKKAESEDDETVLARQKKESDAEEEDNKQEEEEDDDDPNKNKAPELQGGDSDEGEGEDGEEGEDAGAHEFKFAKHRKGWFNRTFRVGAVHDDATILTFKKSLIKKALLKQNRDLDQEAVQAFKNVMSYMGDRKSSKPPIEHAKKMLKNLMVAPAGLRDEVYMQLCKQTTRNPRVSSTIKGWELMSYCLATFPPSKHLKGFLTDFIKKTVKEAKDDKVRELAEVCAQRVPKILKMGQRKQVPSRMELECLKDVKPVPIRVSLVNGTFKSFNVDPYTLVKEVQDQLVEKYNLVVTKPFAMYEAAEANVERILDPKDRVLDVQASWENKPREEAGEEEGAGGGKKNKRKTQYEHKDAGKKVVVRSANFNRFLYKAKLVLKTTNQEIMSDPEAINLIYIQATHDVVTSRYPVNEKDITVLAALQLQATFGDFKRDVHLAGWLAPKIEEFMPKTLLEKKGKKSDKLLKEWEQKILAKYAKVSGFTSLEAKLNYLDYVQEWTFYGSTFFVVEQRQFKDYPSPLTLGINCEGVILMHPEKQTVLENYGFTDIVTWGHSDEKFIVVVGNIVQQRKLIFKTQEGKAMNHLIHDYVKFKVKNK